MHHFQKEKNSTKCIGHQNDNKENARPWQTKTFIQLWFLYLIIPGTRFTRICSVPSHSTTSPGYFGNFWSLSSHKSSEDSPQNLPLCAETVLTLSYFRYNYVLSEPSVWHENWVNPYICTTFLWCGWWSDLGLQEITYFWNCTFALKECFPYFKSKHLLLLS